VTTAVELGLSPTATKEACTHEECRCFIRRASPAEPTTNSSSTAPSGRGGGVTALLLLLLLLLRSSSVGSNPEGGAEAPTSMDVMDMHA
jgi:hypothetical protein